MIKQNRFSLNKEEKEKNSKNLKTFNSLFLSIWEEKEKKFLISTVNNTDCRENTRVEKKKDSNVNTNSTKKNSQITLEQVSYSIPTSYYRNGADLSNRMIS